MLLMMFRDSTHAESLTVTHLTKFGAAGGLVVKGVAFDEHIKLPFHRIVVLHYSGDCLGSCQACIAY